MGARDSWFFLFFFLSLPLLSPLSAFFFSSLFPCHISRHLCFTSNYAFLILHLMLRYTHTHNTLEEYGLLTCLMDGNEYHDNVFVS